jgi:competence protein ComFC
VYLDGSGSLVSGALELLFPGRCLLCGEELLGRCRPFFPVCDPCLERLRPIDAARRCRLCSRPLSSESWLCTGCRSRELAFESNLSLFEYRDPVRELIFRFKFQRRRRMARVLAWLLGQAWRQRFYGLPAVPVPGNRAAVRRRGWDPMVEVGRELARRHGVTVLHLLERRRSREQKDLSYEQRLVNVRGSIRLRRGAGGAPPQLLLIDDVFTTGATLSECARVLRAAGARRVLALTMAID